MEERLPLTERKKNRARERIVRAAEELFLERGFDSVSVAEIADRAEVGRTTFFRYFGDKREVVFAEDQALIAIIADARERDVAHVPATSAEAIAQLREIVVAMSERVTEDPSAYTTHYVLIDQSLELQARDALKGRALAGGLEEILIHRGADRPTAVFASQIALACSEAARRRVGDDPRELVAYTREAFDEALGLGRAPA